MIFVEFKIIQLVEGFFGLSCSLVDQVNCLVVLLFLFYHFEPALHVNQPFKDVFGFQQAFLLFITFSEYFFEVFFVGLGEFGDAGDCVREGDLPMR